VPVGLKLMFLATTLAGATGPRLAIVADTGATVLVTASALVRGCPRQAVLHGWAQ
jgi:cation transport ATPase